MTRLLIADDHPLFRLALIQAVRGVLPEAEVVEADTLPKALDALERCPETDLVLLDLHMPGSHGLAGLAGVRCRFPAVAVVVISANEDPEVIRRALDHGAHGYIPKSTGLDELAEAIDSVLDCREWIPPRLRAAVAATRPSARDRDLAARLASLTPQQFRVLELVAEGKLNKQIADRLQLQERTVKAHLTGIFQRLGVRNRTQASVALRSLQLADPSRTPAPPPTDAL